MILLEASFKFKQFLLQVHPNPASRGAEAGQSRAPFLRLPGVAPSSPASSSSKWSV